MVAVVVVVLFWQARLKIWDYLVETHSDQSDMPAAAEHSDDLIGIANPCSFVGRVDEWKVCRVACDVTSCFSSFLHGVTPVAFRSTRPVDRGGGRL